MENEPTDYWSILVVLSVLVILAFGAFCLVNP